MTRLRRLIPMLLLLVAAAEVPADIDELKQKALSEDFSVSKAALKALLAKGAAHKPVLHEVVAELLTRDKTKVQENAALLADAVRYKATDEKLVALRKS